MSEKHIKIITDPIECQRQTAAWKAEWKSIGLIPTMGYLHEGHASLISRSCRENDRSVVSIFLNPAQFAEGEDLDKYPKDDAADAALCEKLGADIIFRPAPADMYTDDFASYVTVEGMSEVLCGKSRPTHFKGVTTVVTKLLNITRADRAYFGQKDAQQLAIVRRMASDLNFNTEIISCPTVREDDGLAKSSRNAYLSTEERQAAPAIYRAMKEGEELIKSGERKAAKITDVITKALKKEPLIDIEYVSIADSFTLKEIKDTFTSPVLVAVAVKIGSTRLIDNFSYDI